MFRRGRANGPGSARSDRCRTARSLPHRPQPCGDSPYAPTRVHTTRLLARSAAVRVPAQIDDVGRSDSPARRADGAHVVRRPRQGGPRGADAARLRLPWHPEPRHAFVLTASGWDGLACPPARTVSPFPLLATALLAAHRPLLGSAEGVMDRRGRDRRDGRPHGLVAGARAGHGSGPHRLGLHGHTAGRTQQSEEREGQRPEVHAWSTTVRAAGHVPERPVRVRTAVVSRAGRAGRSPGRGRGSGAARTPAGPLPPPTAPRLRAGHR